MQQTDLNKEQQKAVIRAKVSVLHDLCDRVEEGQSFFDAWIDLRSELLRKLKQLED